MSHPSPLAFHIARAIRDRAKKTASGEIVTFDLLHVAEVLQPFLERIRGASPETVAEAVRPYEDVEIERMGGLKLD
jgi:hypothetical protein